MMRTAVGGSLVIVYFRRYHFAVSSFLLNGINPGYLFLFHWHGILLFLRIVLYPHRCVGVWRFMAIALGCEFGFYFFWNY